LIFDSFGGNSLAMFCNNLQQSCTRQPREHDSITASQRAAAIASQSDHHLKAWS
jgi:hypothetical protein